MAAAMSSIATITDTAPRSGRAAGTPGAYTAPVHHTPESTGATTAKIAAGTQTEPAAAVFRVRNSGHNDPDAYNCRVVGPPNQRANAATMSAAGIALAVT